MIIQVDEDRFVSLFMYTEDRELFTAEAAGKLLAGDDDAVLAALEQATGAWVFVGRSRLHKSDIVGIQFGVAGDGMNTILYDFVQCILNNHLTKLLSPFFPHPTLSLSLSLF